MAKVISQEFGNGWAFYNADCVWAMAGLPDESIDFQVESPPFAKLYIYSDSVADMGNSSDDEEFFTGYSFALREKFRVAKQDSYTAIHCKDLMRYRSSHGYSGQDDFPGKIIQAAEAAGWAFQRWITIWKNPVVEMQRTKTYGLLHKSFITRAEVVRQGAPDVVLVFKKQKEQGQHNEDEPMPELSKMVKKRIRHIWSITAKSELERLEIMNILLDNHKINSISDMSNFWKNGVEDSDKLLISHFPLSEYTDNLISYWSKFVTPGRLCFVHCQLLPRYNESGEVVGYFDMMGEIIRRFEAQGSWKFHTRITLTDGTYLVGFRNWTDKLLSNYKELNGQVVHKLRAPKDAAKHIFTTVKNEFHNLKDLAALALGDKEEKSDALNRMIGQDAFEERTEFQHESGTKHPDYIGNKPPLNWHDDGYYSILCWQKYASPVWFDLDDLPNSHKDAWMDIEQTNVLNYKAAKDPEDQKHICPLQLDLIEKLILEYSEPGDVCFFPYGGIGSESVTAIKLDRKAISSELKTGYGKQAVKYLLEAEKQSQQMEMEI